MRRCVERGKGKLSAIDLNMRDNVEMDRGDSLMGDQTPPCRRHVTERTLESSVRVSKGNPEHIGE